MNLITIFSILFIHWIADFVLQTDKEAKGKSNNWNDLISHTYKYSFVMAYYWNVWIFNWVLFRYFKI